MLRGDSSWTYLSYSTVLQYKQHYCIDYGIIYSTVLHTVYVTMYSTVLHTVYGTIYSTVLYYCTYNIHYYCTVHTYCTTHPVTRARVPWTSRASGRSRVGRRGFLLAFCFLTTPLLPPPQPFTDLHTCTPAHLHTLADRRRIFLLSSARCLLACLRVD